MKGNMDVVHDSSIDPMHDTWPMPAYGAPPRLHVHALGIIALQYANLERLIEDLYDTRAGKADVPADSEKAYLPIKSDKDRVTAVRDLYNRVEKDREVVALIDNGMNYFEWCQRCRNTLLHAQQYPPGIGGKPDVLYLIKHQAKSSKTNIYLELELSTLRSIADQFRQGVVQLATLVIHVRYRHQLQGVHRDAAKIAHGPYPSALFIPVELKSVNMPKITPFPAIGEEGA